MTPAERLVTGLLGAALAAVLVTCSSARQASADDRSNHLLRYGASCDVIERGGASFVVCVGSTGVAIVPIPR